MIFRIFSPPRNADFERAMTRVLTGKPSQLARVLIEDLCSHELEGCCCTKFIYGLWHRQLPDSVRQAISDEDFSAANLDNICKIADSNFMSTRTPGSASVAALETSVTSPPPAVYLPDYNSYNPNDVGFHQAWPEQPQVSAVTYARGGRGGRGQQRGRGRGGGYGQSHGNYS